jgi:hypothetical protein
VLANGRAQTFTVEFGKMNLRQNRYAATRLEGHRMIFEFPAMYDEVLRTSRCHHPDGQAIMGTADRNFWKLCRRVVRWLRISVLLLVFSSLLVYYLNQVGLSNFVKGASWRSVPADSLLSSPA